MRNFGLAFVLFVCAVDVRAADWHRGFAPPMSNALPSTQGVVVDDQGYVHIQSFNRSNWRDGYEFVHQYTVDAQGDTPWMWTLTPTRSDAGCGIVARAGARLDCLQHVADGDDATHLIFTPAGGHSLWRATLPVGATFAGAAIRDASALVAVRTQRFYQDAVALYDVQFNAVPVPQSETMACDRPMQTLQQVRFHLPEAVGQPVLMLSVCTGDGSDRIALSRFLPGQGWTTLSRWPLGSGDRVSHALFTDGGQAYALVAHAFGTHEMLRTDAQSPGWMPMPLPMLGDVLAMVSHADTVALIGRMPMVSSPGPDHVMWFDAAGGLPTWMPTPALMSFDAKRFAVSSLGSLVVVGDDPNLPSPSPQLWQVDRFSGSTRIVAAIPQFPMERSQDAPVLIAGPGNVAVIARTLEEDSGTPYAHTEVRVDQYDLLMP